MSPLDDLRISVSQAGPDRGVIVLRLDGVIDTLTAPQLEKVVSQLLQQKSYQLVCDLSGVHYVSSAGWGIFIAHLKEVRDNQGDLRLSRMQPDVSEIFQLLEFDTVINSYDSLEKATEDFTGSSNVPLEKTRPESIVVETLPSLSPAVDYSLTESISIPSQSTQESVTGLEEKVLALVQEDPLLRISEINDSLSSPRFGKTKTSWLKIFMILQKNKLLGLRRRCLFSRQAQKSFPGAHRY